MKSTKIKLNSRHLKSGDKIIRIKPLEGDSSFTTDYLQLVNKNNYHIKLFNNIGCTYILPINKWNDDNWVRYTLD